MRLKEKYIGDRQFYHRLFAVMLPIIIQNAITNFVGMMDNVMVGRLGTLEMSGVSVANLLVFVYNLSIFGAVSGAGIFTAQFYGKGDEEGIRHTFRFKIMVATLITVLAALLVITVGDDLISLYLKGKGDPADAARILSLARSYLNVILLGLIPNALTQAFSSTLRETDKGVPPMVAGLVAVAVNLVLNYILIFGHFGAPRLGVVGAALATAISRFVEMGIVMIWTLRHSEQNPFIRGAFRSLRVPGELVRRITAKGLPLMANETLWAAGIAFLEQRYSTRGLDVVAACNISNTFFNVMAVAFIATGSAVGIIMGQQLGAGKIEEARADAPKMIAFSFMLGVLVGVLYVGTAFVAPRLYNTEPGVRVIATRLMLVTALFMPVDATLNGSYFMVRSGGRTLITMFTDCGLLWLVQCLGAYLLSRYTDIGIIALFTLVEAGMLVKVAVSLWIIARGNWARSVVAENG